MRGSSELSVRTARSDERDRIDGLVAASWGSPCVASRGVLRRVGEQLCLVAEDESGWRGIAACRIDDLGCELILLQAFEQRRGVGTALLAEVTAVAAKAGAGRIWLVTTNDNLAALRFYQRRGFRLAAVRPDAVTQARATLKPEIPLVGEFGIPIRDEVELEMPLRGHKPPAG